MRAGVYGFVPLDASIDELCNAVLAVKSGQLWFDKALLDEMVIGAIEFERKGKAFFLDAAARVNHPLAKRMLDGQFTEGDTIHLDVSGDRFEFSKVR